MTHPAQLPLSGIDPDLLAAILRAQRAHDDHWRWRRERDQAEGPVKNAG